MKKRTIKSWFIHWKKFNSFAFNEGVWKFRYIFHDVDKPCLRLIGMSSEKIEDYHKTRSNHHLEYKNPNKIDYNAVIINWETSKSAIEILNSEIIERGDSINVDKLINTLITLIPNFTVAHKGNKKVEVIKYRNGRLIDHEFTSNVPSNSILISNTLIKKLCRNKK